MEQSDAEKLNIVFNEFQNMLWEDEKCNEIFGTNQYLYHYTTMQAFENIVKSGELWFSHPSLMNDKNEVAYVFDRFVQSIPTTRERTVSLWDNFLESLRVRIISHMTLGENTEIAVFCFTEAIDELEQNDGRLSMWRGYTNNGTGVSFGIDTSLLHEDFESPFIFCRVEYLDVGEINRRLVGLFNRTKMFIDNHPDLTNNECKKLVYVFFEYVLIKALTIKAKHFSEEKEWRLIYLSRRDLNKVFGKCQQYAYMSNGIMVPRFKVKIEDLLDKSLPTGKKWTDLIFKIVVGPHQWGVFPAIGLKAMLKYFKLEVLCDKVVQSRITYRN